MKARTVAISINSSWNIVNFRLGLVAALQREGCRVVALAPRDSYSSKFTELGIDFLPIAIDRKGMSPLKDLVLLWRYYLALRALRPDVLLAYTIKPNVYGSIAAHALGIPVINNVAGLGTAFIRRGLLTKFVSWLYKCAFARSATVFFQNNEDRDQFVGQGIVRADQARLLPGSGIDLVKFAPRPAPSTPSPDVEFLVVARLLWDKGVGEYVEAARKVKAEEPSARFKILGFLDAENRTAISKEQVEAWVSEGAIDYLGGSDDVRPYIETTDCVVLPSYREGLPRVLLEGAAMGKPLIATDVPGCRQVVRHGQNGYLCAARDSAALAQAMLSFIRLSADERESLGLAGRRMVEAEYDERLLVACYSKAIADAVQECRATSANLRGA